MPAILIRYVLFAYVSATLACILMLALLLNGFQRPVFYETAAGLSLVAGIAISGWIAGRLREPEAKSTRP
ncbi:MAG: hypothetical protein KGI94_04295 [Paracoccaceae bacterium]|nr:hypothetical protein [Paracoccaceae bacterium]